MMSYVVEANGQMGGVRVGVYNRALQQYEASDREVVWPGSTTESPKDQSKTSRKGCLAGTYYSEEMLACGMLDLLIPSFFHSDLVHAMRLDTVPSSLSA